ncbi:MAG: tRNA 2-thiouridine synthesizing protein D [Candidatus Pseudothioglobus sp.]|jgi:tRNA 2-thiouridine synthesizing protein D
MQFMIVVQGGPYTTQASLTAWHFARAVLASGHEIYRVFFYHDGAYNGNTLISPPQDEIDLHQAWRSLGKDHSLELIVCVASALRRGMLDETEAKRYEKTASNLDPQFTISGLGQLIDGALTADRTMTFGA